MAKRELIAFPDDLSDFCVAVLHTTESPERLAWLLDDAFGSAFWLLENPFEVTLKKNQTLHTCFHSMAQNEEVRFWLLADADPLIKLRPKADFLLVAKGDTAHELMEFRMQVLKNVQAVQLAYILPAEKLAALNWLPWLQGYPENEQETESIE